MLDEIAHLAMGVVVLVAAAFVRPTIASCPQGYFVEGVRPTGESRCLPVPPPEPSCAGAVRCPDHPPSRYWLPVQIHCTGTTIPTVGNDGRTIRCTRSHS